MSAPSPWLRRPEVGCRRALQGGSREFAASSRKTPSAWVVGCPEERHRMGRAMTPVPGSRRVAGSPIELRGRADSARKLTPGPEPWEGRGQGQHNAGHRALDPDGELDQPLAQRGDLRIRAGGAAGAALEFLEQQVGGPTPEDAELVGQKTRAAGPVHLQPVMQLLEPVL